MTHDLRTDLENTPEGRIAAAAFSILDRIIQTYAHTGHGPKIPDRADFRDGLELYVQREILSARRDEAKRSVEQDALRKGRELYLTVRILDLQKEVDIINRKIAKLEAQ